MRRRPAHTLRDATTDPGARRLWLAVGVVALLTLLAAAPAVGVRATTEAWTTGDEPHYLLTALSLGEDGDLDISDEWAEERWRSFHETPPARQSVVRADGRRVVPHDPGLPALLALPMRLGGAVAAKLTLAALAAALAALTLWTGIRRLDLPVAPTAAVVALFSTTVPLVQYATHVYPEIPAALAVTAVLAAVPGLPDRGALAAAVAGIVALPWLGIKYAPVALVLAALVLWRLHRSGRARRAAGTVALLVAAGIVYAVAHLAWYGGLTVYTAGDAFQRGGQLSVAGDPDLPGRSQRLIGLLVDREFGIAAWQPAWLLGIPALAWVLRRRPGHGTLLGLPLGAGWLVATFVALTMQGWWTPGRQVVVVLPAAVLAVATWATRSRHRLVALGLLGAVGVWSYAWLLGAGLRGDIAWVVTFYRTPDPLYDLWEQALPRYRVLSTGTWVRHGIWTVVALALAVWGWRSAGTEGRRVGVGAARWSSLDGPAEPSPPPGAR